MQSIGFNIYFIWLTELIFFSGRLAENGTARIQGFDLWVLILLVEKPSKKINGFDGIKDFT